MSPVGVALDHLLERLLLAAEGEPVFYGSTANR